MCGRIEERSTSQPLWFRAMVARSLGDRMPRSRADPVPWLRLSPHSWSSGSYQYDPRM
jgi:hypothetical protein